MIAEQIGVDSAVGRPEHWVGSKYKHIVLTVHVSNSHSTCFGVLSSRSGQTFYYSMAELPR